MSYDLYYRERRQILSLLVKYDSRLYVPHRKILYKSTPMTVLSFSDRRGPRSVVHLDGRPRTVPLPGGPTAEPSTPTVHSRRTSPCLQIHRSNPMGDTSETSPPRLSFPRILPRASLSLGGPVFPKGLLRHSYRSPPLLDPNPSLGRLR